MSRDNNVFMMIIVVWLAALACFAAGEYIAEQQINQDAIMACHAKGYSDGHYDAIEGFICTTSINEPIGGK